MYVLIIGGGRTASHLASLLHAQGQEVRLVEYRPDIMAHVHRELPTEVIFEGDGTDPQVLESLEIQRASVVAAVSSDDADNLVAASLARHEYGVRRVIARVNNPRHAWLFNSQFGVDVALNQADIMSKLIQEEMSLGDMMTMLNLRHGDYSIVEEKIEPGARADGMLLKDMQLSPNCVISGIIRSGEIVLPRGNTVLQGEDEVLALVDAAGREELRSYLAKPGA